MSFFECFEGFISVEKLFEGFVLIGVDVSGGF